MNGRPKRRDQIIMFDQGINIKDALPTLSKDKDIITTNSLDEAIKIQEERQCDVLLCSLVLSHSVDTEDCRAIISRLSQKFRNIAFFEPSSHGSKYLEGIGLRSFHLGFDINKSLRSLTVDFLLDQTNAHSITHFGYNAAFDSEATWVVPKDFPANVFPYQNAGGAKPDKIEFSIPVFEYSCYLYSTYDAKQLPFDDDLFFIEKKVQKSPVRLSGVNLHEWILLKDTGVRIYNTKEPCSYGDDRGKLDRLAHRCTVDAAGDTKHPAEVTWTKAIPPSRMSTEVSRLDDCIVAGSGAVISRKRFVAESSYLLPPNAVRDGMRHPNSIGRVEGPAIIAINAVSQNYYHWLTQMMPLLEVARLKLLEAEERSVSIITGRMSRFHHEYLRLLMSDFGEVNLISLKRHEYVTLNQGLYSNLAGTHTPWHLIDEQLLMVETIKKRISLQERAASRRIYISRSDGSGRTVKNESELISCMKARGFEILALSEMSVRDQIAAFCDAEVIVGPHGAGLANILFSSDRAILIELLQSTYANHCMLRLAQNVGARHVAKFFFPDDRSAAWPGAWHIDVHQVGDLLDRTLANPSERTAA